MESDYKVKLEIFEGPLDLLLYLIKRDEIDIYDISIERITRRAGHSPRAVTADRGYGYASVESALHCLGVRSVAIPRATKPGAARREFD